MRKITTLVIVLVFAMTATACGSLPLSNTPVPPTVAASATAMPPATYTPWPTVPPPTPWPTQPVPATSAPLPTIAAPTAMPPTSLPPTAYPTSAPTNGSVSGDCTFSAPTGDPNNWPKTKIELMQPNVWSHRVFNERLFNAANNWGGADSWFVSLAIGLNSGGAWTSHGNPGQVVFRGTSTSIAWCLGVLTTATWKSQFMENSSSMPAGINVRIAPNSPVTVVTAKGNTVTQNTSDAGDITVILPDSGIVIITVNYTTAAPTHESLVWWGPYDRSVDINTIDAR